MPVTLETVAQPTEQDQVDLQKIYADYPQDCDWQALSQQLAEKEAMTLFAGRFNNRLLGAVSVSEENGHLHLNHLCVRAITRQRHVGRDMLRLLLAKYPQHSFSLKLCIDSPATQKLLANAGFQRQDETFVLKR